MWPGVVTPRRRVSSCSASTTAAVQNGSWERRGWNTLPLHLYYVFQCLKCSFICSHRLCLFMYVFVICFFVLVGVPKGESGAAIGKKAGGRSASGCSHYSGLSAGLQSKVNTSSYINTQIPVSEYIYSVYDMFLSDISHRQVTNLNEKWLQLTSYRNRSLQRHSEVILVPFWWNISLQTKLLFTGHKPHWRV